MKTLSPFHFTCLPFDCLESFLSLDELAVDAQLSQLKSWKELIQVISKAAKTDDDILLRRWSLHQVGYIVWYMYVPVIICL